MFELTITQIIKTKKKSVYSHPFFKTDLCLWFAVEVSSRSQQRKHFQKTHI